MLLGMGYHRKPPDDSLVQHVTLAHALDLKPASVTKADSRGKGPGDRVRLSQNRYAYPLRNVIAWCEARGLEWTGSGVRPIKPASQAAP